MGDPIHLDPLIEPGTDCPAGTPVPFPTGTTPSSVRAVIHNVTACPTYPPPPNDLAITLPQHPTFPCAYRRDITFGGHTWSFSCNLSTSSLLVVKPLPFPAGVFNATLDPFTYGPFINLLTCPGNAAGYGTGYILGLVPAYVTELAGEMGFQPDLLALYDDFQAADPAQRSIRITGRTSQGACLFLFEP